MIRRTLTLALALVALARPGHAATTFEYLYTGGYPLAISYDGTVIAGNDVHTYGPFRWTSTDGYQSLGMASAPITGGSGGEARVSADGTRVASTIVGPDSTYATPGLWSLDSGWQYLAMPPGAQVQDRDNGSIWGLSGDGNTAVGLFWPATGRGHAFKWNEATGGVDLGSSGWASRANGANYDGSIIVGWDESTLYGYRTPSVWVNGQLEDLALNTIGEVWTSNSSGDVIGGFQRDSVLDIRVAALWHRAGNGYGPIQELPPVPGTEVGGLNAVESITADGKMAVGYCSFGGDPFYTTGFVWTESDGMMDVVQFLANNGILPDPSFSIQDVPCVTPDGTKLVGFGKDTIAPYTTRAFMIHLDRAAVGVPRGTTPAPRLLSAAPNPVHGATTLSFTLAQAGTGSLTIHDSAGRLVRTLVSGALAAGPHSLAWDARDESGARVPAGVYFTQLLAGSHREMNKLVVVK